MSIGRRYKPQEEEQLSAEAAAVGQGLAAAKSLTKLDILNIDQSSGNQRFLLLYRGAATASKFADYVS